MLNTVRAVVLPLLLAASATEASDSVPTSPVPLITLDEGKVVLVDANGPRVLAECRQLEVHQVFVGPEKGKVSHVSKPCSLWYITAHPSTGRWATTVSIRGEPSGYHLAGFNVSGREFTVPTDRKGLTMTGSILIMGDLNGVVAITTGQKETWTSDGRHLSQMPERFTEDGSRVLVSMTDMTSYAWSSLSFGPAPESIRVLPYKVTDTAGNMLVGGELRTVLRHERGGVRIATQDPAGKRPWKLGPPLGLTRRWMLTPVLLGDTMLFYREAEPPQYGHCDETHHGTYVRYELSTGQERVWRRHFGMCSTNDAFAAVSSVRRTLYFLENQFLQVPELFEYDLQRDVTRKIEIPGVSQVFDLSADGRLLLVRGNGGVLLHDVVTGQTTPLQGVVISNGARLLSLSQ
ncbi:hypothetical protein P2318_19435 [Myxococcaceae bacterium GXIMD 01537]